VNPPAGGCGRGTASITSVAASVDTVFCSIHVGRSVNVARKWVTITWVPSTVSTSNTFAAASGFNEPRRATSLCRSADVPTSRRWSITMRPSAVSCAI
jgi:hypothetical protein